MFGIGFSELLVIMLITLILFGPDKLPQAAVSFGKFMAVLKKNSDALRREFYNSVYTPAEDLRSRIDLSARDLMVFDEKDPANMNCEQKAKKEYEEINKPPPGPITEAVAPEPVPNTAVEEKADEK